ncbi:MAG: phosphatidate cytidylyltransferase [Betaproteobacteria bacterium]|nr:phosphatidate cytidylyltransferase [Betaproteobacteria bacterium]
MRSPEGLLRRVLTAAVLLAVFLAALLLLDKRYFGSLVAAALVIAGHEWGRLAGLGARAALLYGVAIGVVVGAIAWAPNAGASLRDALLGAGVVFWLLLAPAWLRYGVGRSGRLTLAAAGVFALVLAAFAALFLPAGQLLLVLGLVWLADTAAYFAGNAYGRRRLAPSISPGKTWEGAAGAAAATLIYAIICALPGAPLGPYVKGATWAAYLAGAVLLCGVSVVGDLFESALKRRAGAKDSGSLLPGHGGVLDRIDSVMSTLPIAAMLLHLLARS